MEFASVNSCCGTVVCCCRVVVTGTQTVERMLGYLSNSLSNRNLEIHSRLLTIGMVAISSSLETDGYTSKSNLIL